MSTVNTIVEIIIAIFVIYYLIKKYNTLSCYPEPVQKAWADIDTYREQKQNTLQRLYEAANQFRQQGILDLQRLSILQGQVSS